VVVGRGRVFADSSVADLIAAASGDRVLVRTGASREAAAALVAAGAEVTRADQDLLGVRGMAAERIVAVLAAGRVPFSELAPHRATLEEAYLDLTGEAVEYRATTTEVAP